MEEQKFTENEFHRKTAVERFNGTWDLMEKVDRTPREDDLMINGSHASRYHWEQVGTLRNLCVGEWQLSRVYAILKRQEPALYHAQRSLDFCEEDGQKGFYLGYAYEAMARALSLSRDPKTDRFLEKGKQIAQSFTDEEEDDRERLLKDLEEISVIYNNG